MARLSLGKHRRQVNALKRFKMKESRKGIQSIADRAEELARLQEKIDKRIN